MGDNLNKGEKNAQIKGRILHFVTITVVVVAAVVLCYLLWDLLSVGYIRIRHEESAETISITADPTEVPKNAEGEDSGLLDGLTNKRDPKPTEALQLEYPTREDGTGDAGIMEVKDGRSTSSGLSGWQTSDGKLWYEVSRNTCYYGGWKEIGRKTYYFDQEGYAVTGWYCMSYQNGCYFDQDGVYEPGKERSRFIAFTFDCSPSEYTQELLDVLARNNAKATFFVQGNKAEQYGSIIERIAAAGHSLGCYTYSGNDLSAAGNAEVISEFSKTDEIIAKYNGGKGASCVRFPNGNFSQEKVMATGKANIYWDCETYDLETSDTNQIAANISAQLAGGVIIHMHDLTASTVKCLDEFLPVLASTGYEFVNIEDMAASRGYKLEAGVTFYGFTDEKLAEGRVNDK